MAKTPRIFEKSPKDVEKRSMKEGSPREERSDARQAAPRPKLHAAKRAQRK